MPWYFRNFECKRLHRLSFFRTHPGPTRSLKERRMIHMFFPNLGGMDVDFLWRRQSFFSWCGHRWIDMCWRDEQFFFKYFFSTTWFSSPPFFRVNGSVPKKSFEIYNWIQGVTKQNSYMLSNLACFHWKWLTSLGCRFTLEILAFLVKSGVVLFLQCIMWLFLQGFVAGANENKKLVQKRDAAGRVGFHRWCEWSQDPKFFFSELTGGWLANLYP